MIEGLVVILGLCITFLPFLLYFNYLLTHVNKKTRFDYHLEIIKDKKGKIGIVIAYLERILFGIVVCSFGILMSEFFASELFFKIFVISLIVYILLKYFDEKNEK